MLELTAGVVVAIAVLVVVLEPLVRSSLPASGTHQDPRDDIEPIELEELESPKIRALLALKEIEFDRATGKLSEEDYATLKRKYATAALAAMDAEKDIASAAEPTHAIDNDIDLAEAAIRRAKAHASTTCPQCGPRPEPHATFCSACGRSLTRPESSARCWLCGGAIPDGAKFCSHCGKGLAVSSEAVEAGAVGETAN